MPLSCATVTTSDRVFNVADFNAAAGRCRLLTWRSKSEDGLCKDLEKQVASVLLGAPSAADTICESPVAPKLVRFQLYVTCFYRWQARWSRSWGRRRC